MLILRQAKTEQPKVVHICLKRSSPIFYLLNIGERRLVFFKEFKIKDRVNLSQPTGLLRQFFEALIKNSPRLRGAPQVVQRLRE